MKSLIYKSIAILFAFLLFSCNENSVSPMPVSKPIEALNGNWVFHGDGYPNWQKTIMTSESGIMIDKLYYSGYYTDDSFIGCTLYHNEIIKDSINLRLSNDTIYGSTKAFTKTNGIYEQTFSVQYSYTRVK